MKNILILYFSGVGNTRYITEIMCKYANSYAAVETYSIEKLPINFDANSYDALIIGFPTYHSAPAKPILDFLDSFSSFTKETPTFIFTTCGLYSANSVRIFAKKCISNKKNMIPILSSSYRTTATDGSLLAPFMKCWFKHENGLEDRVKKDITIFLKNIEAEPKIKIPRFKLYSIINYLNKWAGEHITFRIYLHKNKCTKCRKCITHCPKKAYETSNEGFPLFVKKNCINCYRCIHHCPELALSLSKRKTHSKTLYRL